MTAYAAMALTILAIVAALLIARLERLVQTMAAGRRLCLRKMVRNAMTACKRTAIQGTARTADAAKRAMYAVPVTLPA